MAKVIEEIRLILVEVGKNSNKWWTGRLYDNGDAETLWGRTGYDGDSKMFPGRGRAFLEKKQREKEKKGYTPLKTVGGPAVSTSQVRDMGDHELKTIAKSQLIKTSNPILDKLIDRLVQANVHRITSATQITYNASTGLFSTPLGIVTPDGIQEARDILVKITGHVRKGDFSSIDMVDYTNAYMRLVPQHVGMRFDIRKVFPDAAACQKQDDILDSLEASYAAMQKQPATKGKSKKPVEQVFRVDMDVLSDGPERRRLIDWYEKSKKRMHGYDNVHVRQAYVVKLHDMDARYDTKLGTDTEVFHGTSQANCLSIMKSGLHVAPPSTAAIAGKMWGNGVYGAINSTKSLGYTFGRWGQSSSDCGWLFVCDFAMGNVYYPGRYGGVYSPPRGYDSVWATAAKTGLHNDELIVYRDNQVRIKYLLECK